ncbi:MAG: hypothetical protein ACRD5G_06905 [Candidatus Acidiferrales bacterium]
MTLNKEQREVISELLHAFVGLIIENQALKVIAIQLQNRGPFAGSTVQEQLDALMRSPARDLYEKQFSPFLQQIDSAFQDAELSELLSKIPLKGPIQ